MNSYSRTNRVNNIHPWTHMYTLEYIECTYEVRELVFYSEACRLAVWCVYIELFLILSESKMGLH